MPPTDGAWIDGSCLVVGDVFTDCKSNKGFIFGMPDSAGWGWRVTDISERAGERWVTAADVIDGRSSNWGRAEGYSWFVVDRQPSVPAAPAPYVWNGVCARCGKGTYRGFNSFEHEGGSCV